MCCFSRRVDFVSATQIFARRLADGRQVLVYSMNVGAPEPLAMILPIPVAAGAGEEAVRFVDLHAYGEFFNDLKNGYPQPASLSPQPPTRAAARPTLKVVEVGDFVASFVPQVSDFDRLDARFRLPVGVWQRLPQYASYGFAVFQLKPGRARIHPMAFSFPSALVGRLFFPTVHIHDGSVNRRARFDHLLYCQVTHSGQRAVSEWQESDAPAARFVNVKKARDLVVGDRHIFRHGMSGMLPNADVILSAA